MPSCLRSRVGVGAHEAEDPVGDVRERGPDLLAVDDVVIAVAATRRSSATRGRSPSRARNSPGTRSRRRGRCAAGSAASAPSVPNFSSTGAAHREAERQQRRRAGVAALLLEDVALHARSSRCRPIRAARPARSSPCRRGSGASAGARPCRELLVASDLVAQVGGQVVAQPGAHLVAKGAFVGGIVEIHGDCMITPKLATGLARLTAAPAAGRGAEVDSGRPSTLMPPALPGDRHGVAE